MEDKNSGSDIKSFLKPKSIAVVGASADLSTVGGKCVRFLRDHLYQGKIFPVNPKYAEIGGLKCYGRLLDIRFEINMAIIIISVKYLFSVLEECLQKGVKSIVVFTGGFKELGNEEGRKRQYRLREFVNQHGIKLLGPNCYGFINFIDKVAESGSSALEAKHLVAGKVGLVSVSGSIGLSVIPFIYQTRGQGLSYAVNTGNEVGLDVCDFMKFMVEDRNTEVIASVIEEIRSGEKFLKVAELALQRNKPLIVLKIGRSEEGKRAAALHTGAMTGCDRNWEGVFRQKGVIRVDDINELFEVSWLFSKCSVPGGEGIGMISPSGGVLAFATDMGGTLGLNFPRLSYKSLEKLSETLKGFSTCMNPVDLSALAVNEPQIYEKTLEVMLEDENINLVVLLMTIALSYDELCRAIVSLAESTNKPIIVAWIGGSFSEEGLKILERNRIPVFNSIEKCLKAVKAFIEYGKFIKRYREENVVKKKETIMAVNVNMEKIRDSIKARSTPLTEDESKELLSHYGIRVTKEKVATSSQDAIKIARHIGYPVALKSMSRRIIQKSDADAIRLNVKTDIEVEVCFQEVMNNAKRYDPAVEIKGVLVQEMVRPGIEIIVGMSKDPTIGHMIMFGLGGIFAGILEDFAARVAPITRIDAIRMIEETKACEVLKGARNKPKADLKAVVNVLLKISKISLELGDVISEIEINPLVVFEEGKGCKVVNASIITKGFTSTTSLFK